MVEKKEWDEEREDLGGGAHPFRNWQRLIW